MAMTMTMVDGDDDGDDDDDGEMGGEEQGDRAESVAIAGREWPPHLVSHSDGRSF
jgi:hypothetical protein